MAVVYEKLKHEYLGEIYDLVVQNKDILKPNTQMIYFIINRLFSELSVVAKFNNKVIGFVVCFSNSNRNEVWLHQLAVSKLHRGKGIAKGLILALEKKCLGQKINFSVKSDNTSAIRLYHKLGYHQLKYEAAIDQIIFEKQL